MKGRNPTAAQARYHTLLVERIGCVACHHDRGGYQRNHEATIHHVDGRTKQDAHWLVLPLCAGHHQDGYGAPGRLAVHPFKARFEARYGRQDELIRACAEQLLAMEERVPERVMELAGIEVPA